MVDGMMKIKDQARNIGRITRQTKSFEVLICSSTASAFASTHKYM